MIGLMKGYLDRIDRIVRPRGHVFYGWWIVLGAGGVQWLSALLWMSSYGAYVVLLEEEFQWSKAALAGAFALTRIESGILGPLQGWLIDRYGPRPVLNLGIVAFGVGFMLFSRVQTIVEFYLAFALMALGASLGGYATLTVSLVNWFNRHRATAVSLSQLGFSLGGLCVPLVVFSLESYGWRATAFCSGVLVLLIGLPLVRVVRHRPQDFGETPDGLELGHMQSSAAAYADFTARQAMRTPAFWLLSSGHALSLLIVAAVMVHLVPHLSEGHGYSLVLAGQAVMVMTAFQMVGQLVGGYLGDRFNKRIICAVCMAAHGVGLLVVTHNGTLVSVLLFCILHGLAWGIRGPLMVALRAEYFGVRSFATISGFSALIVMLGMSGGPVIAGLMADHYGDYKVGFSVLAGLVLLGALIEVLFVRFDHARWSYLPRCCQIYTLRFGYFKI